MKNQNIQNLIGKRILIRNDSSIMDEVVIEEVDPSNTAVKLKYVHYSFWEWRPIGSFTIVSILSDPVNSESNNNTGESLING